MLLELDITSFAIIDHLHLRFDPALNALTGETGAGKSIIVDALGLLLGGRASSEMIRAGQGTARVEGIFELDSAAQALLQPLLEEFGLEVEDRSLILARELHSNGRHVCRANGRAVPLNVLQQIGDRLVDIHGQSEHLSLLRVKEHVEFLDRYGNLLPARAEVADQVRQVRRVRKDLKELQKDQREIARRVDRLSFMLQEIKAARLKPGEDQTLKQERELLGNAEQRANLAGEAYQALYGQGEEQSGALDLLSTTLQALTSLTKFDQELGAAREQAESLVANADDLARTLRAYRDGVEFNPKRLDKIEERLDLIFRLKRKYGDSIADILTFAENSAVELAGLEHSEERILSLQQQEQELLLLLGRQAGQLSEQRRAAAGRMASAIEHELDDLGMARAHFEVQIEQVHDDNGAPFADRRVAFDNTGIDRVEFLVAPNPGEPPKPLAKIASGGETSRLMLALKAVLGSADRTPTLIFDEIDQGLGGRTGGIVGRKLWALTGASARGEGEAWRHQVICITHLPQIAAYADRHFSIRKDLQENRTTTHVQELVRRARVDELAQMLGNPTELTRKSAEEMLRASAADKQRANTVAPNHAS